MQYTPVLLLLAFGVAGAVQWNVTRTDGTTCVIFAAETITVKLNIQNTDNVTDAISFAINDTQRVTGNCDDKWNGGVANSLEVSFFPDGQLPLHATDGQPWSLKLWFAKPADQEDMAFKLVDYSLTTSPLDKYNSTTQVFRKSNASDLDAHASGTNAFRCSTSGLALTSDQLEAPESTIQLKDTKMIGNARLNTTDFPTDQVYEQCALDSKTSDIVPIVVGACLAGLVAVVLVAYLVGRARAKRQGYASV